MKLKEQLINQCRNQMSLKLKNCQSQIESISNSLQSETKSSAGDKHETSRAMLQLEREKAGFQLAQIQTAMQVLDKISNTTSTEKISLGSVVHTTDKNFLISISAGLIKMGKNEYYAISAQSPIGSILIGKTKGDSIKFRDQSFVIIDVF